MTDAEFNERMTAYSGVIAETWVLGLIDGDTAMKMVVNYAADLLGQPRVYEIE
jgi:hypothetical protein